MKRLLLALLLLLAGLTTRAQTQAPYFPPTTGTTWATTSPQSLGWCQPRLDSLLQFLGRRHTKSFIILKDGRMVVEQYYGTFTQDSLWYWASAGKSLTATLVGIAQQEGLVSLDDKASRFLGRGWTAAVPAKEDLITVRHQLSMTTGLDDTPPAPCDLESAEPACLRYRADAGTRWAYHSGPYRLLQDQLAAASGLSINQFTNQRLGSRIGMAGLWRNYVYFSRARDMARFGLLILSRGNWNQVPVLADTAYFRRMTTSSQPYNRSYGYLWWLNGQASFMLPGAQQTVFTGALVPTAPPDMLAALGKNDQKIYVVPSLGLVVVRQGESAGLARQAVSSFDTELWRYLSAALSCNVTATAPRTAPLIAQLYPNPAHEMLTLELPAPVLAGSSLLLMDMMGREIRRQPVTSGPHTVSLADVAAGVYLLQVRASTGTLLAQGRVLKQ